MKNVSWKIFHRRLNNISSYRSESNQIIVESNRIIVEIGWLKESSSVGSLSFLVKDLQKVLSLSFIVDFSQMNQILILFYL